MLIISADQVVGSFNLNTDRGMNKLAVLNNIMMSSQSQIHRSEFLHILVFVVRAGRIGIIMEIQTVNDYVTTLYPEDIPVQYIPVRVCKRRSRTGFVKDGAGPAPYFSKIGASSFRGVFKITSASTL